MTRQNSDDKRIQLLTKGFGHALDQIWVRWGNTIKNNDGWPGDLKDAMRNRRKLRKNTLVSLRLWSSVFTSAEQDALIYITSPPPLPLDFVVVNTKWSRWLSTVNVTRTFSTNYYNKIVESREEIQYLHSLGEYCVDGMPRPRFIFTQSAKGRSKNYNHSV